MSFLKIRISSGNVFAAPVLQAGTQGIYGLLIAFIIVLNIGVVDGNMKELTLYQGWVLFSCGLTDWHSWFVIAISAVKACAASIHSDCQTPGRTAKGLIFGAMVETLCRTCTAHFFIMVNGVKL